LKQILGDLSIDHGLIDKGGRETVSLHIRRIERDVLLGDLAWNLEYELFGRNGLKMRIERLKKRVRRVEAGAELHDNVSAVREEEMMEIVD
jgi:hypothetical protein